MKRSELGLQCPVFEGEGNNDFWEENTLKKRRGSLRQLVLAVLCRVNPPIPFLPQLHPCWGRTTPLARGALCHLRRPGDGAQGRAGSRARAGGRWCSEPGYASSIPPSSGNPSPAEITGRDGEKPFLLNAEAKLFIRVLNNRKWEGEKGGCSLVDVAGKKNQPPIKK